MNSERWTIPSSEIPYVNVKDEEFSAKQLVPNLNEIPENFENKNYWLEFHRSWYEDGIESIGGLVAKNGISSSLAFAHLSAIQSDTRIGLKNKSLAIAWLASLWFVCDKNSFGEEEAA